MADLFISYKKDDRAIAERLVKALHASGRQVWWDDALTPNEAWDALIEKEIAAARAVIVLWSPRSVQSDWVRSEAHYAQDHHKLIPVMIEPCAIPLAFMLRQAVDLSGGKCDASNPNWGKLLAWIDAIGSDQPAPSSEAAATDTAAAAVPVKALSGDRWLGPATRRRGLIAIPIVLLLFAIGLFLIRGSPGLGGGARPDVYVDPVSVTADPSIPAGFSQAIADELASQLNAASRITPLDGDGKRHSDAYQMTGNVRVGSGKLLLSAKIFAPGIAAPVLSPMIEVPPEQRAGAAKFLGAQAANILRCVATASDSVGSEILVLPEDAIRPWAQFCQMSLLGGNDLSTPTAALERVVKAAPDFANGWATLAEFRSINIKESEAGPFREAYRKALAIDPKNPKALMLKAIDVLDGYPGRPLRNFEEFDRLAKEANEARPSDCGCEAQIYRDILFMTGRYDDALVYLNRIIANNPASLFNLAQKSYVLAALGRSSEARLLIDDMKQDWPGAKHTVAAEFSFAVANKDWATARALAPKLRPFPGQDHAQALIDALKAENRTAIDAAVAPMVAGLDQIDSISAPLLSLIAAAGRNREIAQHWIKATDKYGGYGFYFAWNPDLKAARAEPEFLNLLRRYDLPGFWRVAGHRPDICKAANPEPFCKLI